MISFTYKHSQYEKYEHAVTGKEYEVSCQSYGYMCTHLESVVVRF